MNKRFFLIICFTIFFSILNTSMAFSGADRLLNVSPNRVIFKNDDKFKLITVINNSNVAKRYNLEIVNQVMQENGLLKPNKNFIYSAQSMLRFSPKRFTLKSGETKQVKVKIRDKNLADGDYHSHLLFREVPLNKNDKKNITAKDRGKKTSFEITSLYGVAVPVIIEKGETHSNIKISDASLSQIKDNKNKSIRLLFNRSGNAEASAFLNAKHITKKDLKKRGANIFPDRLIRIYREVDLISQDIAISNYKDKINSGDKILLSMFSDVEGKKGGLISQKEIIIP